MKKILVPTDFSEASNWAVDVAIGIAQRSKAEIILLHIVEFPTSQSFDTAGEWDLSQNWEEKVFTLRLIKKANKDLREIEKRVTASGAEVRIELKIGSAYHGISTIIGEQEVDLIVMGTFGHTRLERIFVGSTTDRVIRHSRCPVLTVHECPDSNLFENIVYATSINDDEVAFSRVIKTAQQLYNSKVHLVRVNTPSNFSPDNSMKKSMEEFATRLELENYTVNVFNDDTEEEGILHFAESIRADLIGLVTHARSGFSRLLTGSISEQVINQSRRPVLTYITD